ncbi:MAG: hypothetical protein ACOYXC_10020 [Candidatus Rifleibacteriota bacterium]
MRKSYWCLCFVLALLLIAPISGFAQTDDQQTTAISDDGKTNDLPQVSDPDVTNELPKVSAPDDVTNDLPKVSPPNPGDTISKPIGMPNPIYGRIKEMRAELQKLTRQRKFDQAEKLVETIKTEMKKLDRKDYSNMFADLHRNEVVKLHSMQGEYMKAANAVRTAIKYNEIKSDVKLLLNTQEKVGLQKEWFDIRQQHEREITKLLETKQPMLKEKLAILNRLNSKMRLTDEQIKKLQTELKAVNEKLHKINKTIEEVNRKFMVKRDRFSKKDIVLNKEQQKKLQPLVMKRYAVRYENYKLHKAIARHLSDISENSEITWKDLRGNFEQLAKLQEEIWSLRKRLDFLAGKAPLTEEDYAAAKAVRNQLEKLIDKAEDFMGKVEDAFVDAKTFSKLTLQEKLEFVKLFRDVWSRDREFDNLKPSLEDLYKKIFDAPIVIDDPKPEPGPTPKPEPVEQISGEGYIILEGNIWLLRFGDKVFYPVNLPTRYQVNKLEVKFAGEVVTLIEPNLKGDDATTDKMIGEKWWLRYPRISFTYVTAPQLPDEPYEREPNQLATPTEVIEENIDNQDKPANLMNSF